MSEETKKYYEEHKFRYLLPPGNNFQFVAKFKSWLVMSVILMSLAIASLFVNRFVIGSRGEYMNWTIDFKGGTEIVFAFLEKKANGGKKPDEPKVYTKVDPAVIRHALEKAGEDGFDVSENEYSDEHNTVVNGMVVKTP